MKFEDIRPFGAAAPIFYPGTREEGNFNAGFRGDFTIADVTVPVTVTIAARSFYRLYINGTFVMHGPARSAAGVLRADCFDVSSHLIPGKNALAIEVISQGKLFGEYSNEVTLEPGILIFEVCQGEGILSASGADTPVTKITERTQKAERISHCRGAMEIYRLTSSLFSWRQEETTENDRFVPSEVVPCDDTVIPRGMPYPSLEKHGNARLVEYGGFFRDEEKEVTTRFYEKQLDELYQSFSERPLRDVSQYAETAYSGNVTFIPGGVSVSGKENVFLHYDFGESFVGFIGLTVRAKQAGVIDLVHSEAYDRTGGFPLFFNTTTRLHTEEGEYTFIKTEPALLRYLKIYLTPGDWEITGIHVVEYTFPDPDTGAGFFACSDDDLNRLYRAARKTLILNTMDIFMDCPDRERGGWLCDSFFTARAAAQMTGDTSVERAFLQNFLQTDPAKMWQGFFPEVYPGHKDCYPVMTGITTWSFYLILQFCEYIRRTGDSAFAEKYRPRVEAFIQGTRKFIGKSGLLEKLPFIFIDWSQANHDANTQPISVAANALYIYMLRSLSDTYARLDLGHLAKRMAQTLKDAVLSNMDEHKDYIPDSLTYHAEKGTFKGNGVYSEAAHYTTLWSGLLSPGDCPSLDFSVVHKMGPTPDWQPASYLGPSGLFIGLCIRFDLLAKYGAYEKLLSELKTVFYPQLTEGPGTLWENRIFETSSRCHGFAAHVGVHLTRDILGLHPVDEEEKTIRIAPHPCGLRYARGTEKTLGGVASLSWHFGSGEFFLSASIPAGYAYEITLPNEVKILPKEKIHIQISSK